MSGSAKKTGRGATALDYYARKGFSEAQLRQIEEDHQLGRFAKLDEVFSRGGGFWQDTSGRFSKYLKDGERVHNHSDENLDHLKQFCRGFNPHTGDRLVQNAGDTRQTGYDFTLSAPKSFSILWAFSDAAGKAKLEAMFEAAVTRANDQFNLYANKTRAGKAGVDRVEAQYAFAKYLEFTGRPVDTKGNLVPENEIHAALNEAFSDGEYGDGMFVDMQIHCHSVMPNMAACGDGKMRAVNGQYLFAWQGQWAEAMHAELAKQCLDAGIPIVVADDKVAFEVEGINEEVIQSFSKRSKQIEQNKKELGIEGVADTAAGRALEQLAKTKDRKHHVDVTEGDVHRHWATRAEIYGFASETANQILAKAAAQGPIRERPTVTQKDIQDLMDAFLKNDSVITEARLRAAATGLWGVQGVDVDAIQNQVSKFLKTCVQLGEKNDVAVYSTQEMINLEREMLDIAVRSVHENGFTADDVEAAIERVYQRKLQDDPNAKMSDQQKEAVRFLCNSTDGVVVLEGRAGAGKSFTMDAVREVYQSAGYRLEGLSLGWAQADTLKTEGKLDSAAAVEGFVRKLKTGQIKLTQRSVVVLDEGSLVGSAQMHAILAAVKAASGGAAKCVISGDTRQIQSVAAGGAMRVIRAEKAFQTGRDGSFELDEVRRQRKEWDKKAGLAISALNPSAAIAAYLAAGRENFKPEIVDGRLVDSGRFLIADNRTEALEQLFQKFIQYRLGNLDKSAVMVAVTNKEVDELNQRAFKTMQSAGLIGPSVIVKTVVGKTEKDLEIGEGAIVQFREKSGKAKVLNDDGTEAEREVFNRTFGKIEKIDGAGEEICLHVRLLDGDKLSDKVIEIRPSDFRSGEFSLQHGTCLTAASVQGKTYDAAFIMGGGLDAAGSYVACTRHREDLCIAIDKDSLYAHASRNFDADDYLTRNQFTDLNALDTLAAQWRYESIKETTIDYLDKHHHDAMIAKRLAKDQNPKVSTLILGAECARLESQVKQLEPEKIREAFRVCKIADAAREKFVRIKDFANVDHLKTTIVQAAKDFGNKLHFSGNKQFHEAVAKVLCTKEMRQALGTIEIASQKTAKAIRDLFRSTKKEEKEPMAAAIVSKSSIRSALNRSPDHVQRTEVVRVAKENAQAPKAAMPLKPEPQKPDPTPTPARKKSRGQSL